MKCCNNCANARNCFYKGIINPCNDWRADVSILRLKTIAKKIHKHKMSYEEHRFVESCIYAVTFTPKQEQWLRSIHARVTASRTLV